MNTVVPSGNEDMHKSLDEFKFRPDTITNSRVICPCVSEKLMYNVVNTLAPVFLIGSSSFLKVRRTTIYLTTLLTSPIECSLYFQNYVRHLNQNFREMRKIYEMGLRSKIMRVNLFHKVP